MKVNLQNITTGAEENIVEIARVSSIRKDKKENPEGLINYLIKHKHWSPFEHGFMTIEIDTSKAIGIQLIRHRSFTFQEFSQRYSVVQEIEEIELRQQAETNRQSSTDVFDPLVPGDYWREDFELPFNKQELEDSEDDVVELIDPMFASDMVEELFRTCQNAYLALLNAGVARECARMVLPMATSTKIYMSGTIRSWIHFIQIRDDEHAQKEIREIASEIKNIFIEQLPLISNALGWTKN